MKVKLIAHTPDPDKVVSMAAKLCYSPIGVEAMSEKITSEEVEKFLGKFNLIFLQVRFSTVPLRAHLYPLSLCAFHRHL